MIGAKTIFVVPIIDRDFDGNRGVNQANNGGWDPDKVRVSAVRRARKSEATELVKCNISISYLIGSECLRQFLPSNVSHQSTSDYKHWLLHKM